MSWLAKIRPQVFLGIVALAGIAVVAICLKVDYANEVATGCIVGIAGILPKLVESEP